MAQKTTKPIAEQRSILTKRQELDVRTKLMGKTTRVLNRIMAVAEGTEEMSAMEFKACELLLKKTLPDLSAVQHVEKDDLADMDRTELLSTLSAVVSANPALLNLPEVKEAVNAAQSVNDIAGSAKIVDITPSRDGDT